MGKNRFVKRFSAAIYSDIALFGQNLSDCFSVAFKKFFGFTKKIAEKSLLVILGFLKSYFRYIKRIFSLSKKEFILFRSEIARALPNLKKSFKSNHFKGLTEFSKYTLKAFHLHKNFSRAVFASVVPVFAICLFLSFFAAFSNLIFALEVFADGESIGIVRNEEEYKASYNLAKTRFSSADDLSESFLPEYKLTLTSIGNLDSNEAVCNKIVAAISDDTVTACGVYCDGKFICAVGSEDTYNRIVDKVISEFKAEYGFDSDKYTVSFVSEFSTVTGLYPRDSKLLSADEFYLFLSGYSENDIEYTVLKGEKLDDILNKTSLTEEQLLKLNSDLNPDYIPEGSVLLIKKGKRNFSIKAEKTYTYVETTSFESVKQYDNNLYVGTQMTIVTGTPGRDVVSYSDIYIDGSLVDKNKEISRYKANTPVNELIKIGTFGIPVGDDSKPVSPRLTRDQGGTFVWPTPDNCFWLSQEYKASSHYGIDIVSSDSSSCKGRPIVSVADGVVILATYHHSWGYYIRIDHGDGVVSAYAHALKGSFKVNTGDYVKAGQQISSIGTTGRSTGYHLHFEIWVDGVRTDPLPFIYSKNTGIAIKK